MFHIISTFCVLLLALVLAAFSMAGTTPKSIGIILPLEHEAMTQIVAGIKESLQDMNVTINVKNAHSDSNLMLAVIKQMKSDGTDIIMPVGTTASQMTVSHIKDKSVICVASLPCNSNHTKSTGIGDEIPITSVVGRLNKLKNIGVIYSASEKVVPELEELKAFAAKNNINLHLNMIQNLVDLPSAVRTMSKDIEAFLILKDHLVASGISIVVIEASHRLIPVITADEGSVLKGATLSIGVREKDIGIQAGNVVKQILSGVEANNIPYKLMDDIVVFYNKQSFAKQNILSKEDIKSLNLNIIEY